MMHLIDKTTSFCWISKFLEARRHTVNNNIFPTWNKLMIRVNSIEGTAI